MTVPQWGISPVAAAAVAKPPMEPGFPPLEIAMLQRFFLCAFSLFLLPCGFVAGQTEKRLPIPAKKDLAKAEELVQDIFKEEIGKAKDADARSKLAGYLAQQGDESTE